EDAQHLRPIENVLPERHMPTVWWPPECCGFESASRVAGTIREPQLQQESEHAREIAPAALPVGQEMSDQRIVHECTRHHLRDEARIAPGRIPHLHVCGACRNLTRHRALYRFNSRIAASRPPSVSGNMRPFISCERRPIDGV